MSAPQYLKVGDVAKRYSIGKTSVWRAVKKRTLPQPVKLAPRTTRWRLEDLDKWDAEKLTTANAEHQPT